MKKGFTLIELLVVIAIIAIISTLLIIRVGNAINDAKITKMKADTKEIANAMYMAKVRTGKNLTQITGSVCSDCTHCRGNQDLRNIPDSHLCMVDMLNAFNTIEAASGIGITKMARDPWGSPYLLDENEGTIDLTKPGYEDGCYKDHVRSVGPSGISPPASTPADGIHVWISNAFCATD